MFYYSSWAKTLNKFTNIVNPNSQLRRSIHLLVHSQLPKHIQLSNNQQCMYLMLETKIKTIMFCIPKITSRMMEASQITTKYSLVIHQENIISFQPIQPLIAINNFFYHIRKYIKFTHTYDITSGW